VGQKGRRTLSRRAPLGAILGGAALISVLTICARAAGFARWAVFSPAVGSTATGSAYTAANALPNVLFELAAGGALAVVVVPLAASPLAKRAKGEVSQIGSALMTWALTVLVPLAAVLALVAEPLTGLILDSAVQREHPGAAEAAARLLVMFAPQVPLYGVGVVAAGLLQAGKRFFWPALAPLLSSLTVIGAYGIFAFRAQGQQNAPADLPPDALAWLGLGTTAGVAVLTLPLLIPLARMGLRWRWTYRFPPGVGRRARALAGAGLGGLVAQQLSVLAVVFLANGRGGSGALPLYHYAQAVFLLPYAVLALSLATAAFPHLSDSGASGDKAALRDTAAASSRIVLLAAAVGAAALGACAPAVQGVFGAIDRSGGAAGLGTAVTLFAPGLVGFAILTHLQRVLYAAGRAALGALAAGIGWMTVAAASVALALAWTADGVDSADALAALGTASSVGLSVGGLVALAATRRALGPGALSGLGRTGAASVLAALVGGGVGRLVCQALGAATGWQALGAGVAAAAAATALAAVGAVALDGSVRGAFSQLRSAR
jgi:putative peptidoglycan lipid II flippase